MTLINLNNREARITVGRSQTYMERGNGTGWRVRITGNIYTGKRVWRVMRKFTS